jgi:hypothetical protein
VPAQTERVIEPLLADRGAKAGEHDRLLLAAVVLHVHDAALADAEHLRPVVATSGAVGPGERGHDAVAVLLDAVDAVVVMA